MSATTRISFEEFLKMSETEEGVRYELDEGELLVPPSPTLQHNEVRYRIHQALREFSRLHKLGYVTGETDFRLGPDTVRRPDVSFITTAHLARIDTNRSPVAGAPALAVEIISPSNLAQDTVKKVHQYLAAGSDLVWLVYPSLKLIQVHEHSGSHEVTQGSLQAEKLLPGFNLPLAEIFDDDLLK